MKPLLTYEINEKLASVAFNRQSVVFDELYGSNSIVRYKRERVYEHVDKFLPAGSYILELNAGTGEDALHFAGKGHRVHATDIASRMQETMVGKIKEAGLTERITNELCSFTRLADLEEKGPFDMILSNFAGLNCTGDLDKVLRSFKPLLRPGGLVTLVIMPPFCIWESMLLFKGKFRTALRRLSAGRGVPARVEGTSFYCWYYRPSYIIRRLRDSYDVLQVEGLCSIVPPSYMENFAEIHPSLFRALVRLESRFKQSWPWKFVGDYYIISLRKKV
jgi:ubiquinone/menaquinone biosynthesis C-methylase UbiE